MFYQTNFNEDSEYKDEETLRISHLNVHKNTESQAEDKSLRREAKKSLKHRNCTKERNTYIYFSGKLCTVL